LFVCSIIIQMTLTILKAEDRLQIMELASRYNKSLDHRDIDEWLENID